MKTSEDVVVSVITPAYNVDQWIGEAVDSVLTQTEKRFEYVIVDDGSTDETASIVEQRAQNDPRIRLIRTENRGSSAARNRGLAETSAPFVAFLDGDDRWHPEFLQHLLRTLEQASPDVGVAYCHTRVMLENGQVVALRWQPRGPIDLDQQLIENNPTHNGSSLMIRRACFEQVGNFNETLRSAVDMDMWLRIAAHSQYPTMWGTRRYLLDMRLMRTGSISSNRGQRFEALDTVLSQYAPMMTQHSGLAYIRPAVFAYRDGFDEIGERWGNLAIAAGQSTLARDSSGRELLVWHLAGRDGRVRLRNLRDRARGAAYSGLSILARTANKVAGAVRSS